MTQFCATDENQPRALRLVPDPPGLSHNALDDARVSVHPKSGF